MNKYEFLAELKNLLYGLPDDDVQKSLDFYSEMIDDRTEDGLTEGEAIAQIGTPQEIAKQILMEIPITKLVKQKIKPKHQLRALEIVLLILGSPIWLSLFIALLAVVFSVYIVLWSVIISLYAVSSSLVACGVAGVASFAVFAVTGNMTQGLFIVGSALVCIGLAILMFMVSNLVTKGLLWLSKKIWLGIKRCFIKRGDCNENC